MPGGGARRGRPRAGAGPAARRRPASPRPRTWPDAIGDPALATYTTWRQLREGDPAPFAAYRDFLDQHPRWPDAAILQIRAEDAIDSSVPPDAIVSFFAERTPRTRQGRLQLAGALLQIGRAPEATTLIRKSWIEDDYGPGEEQFVLGSYGYLLRPEDHLARLEQAALGRQGPAGPAHAPPRRSRPPQPRFGAAARSRRSGPNVDGAIQAVPAALRNDPGLVFDRLQWRRRKGLDQSAQGLLLSLRSERVRPSAWWRERSFQIREAINGRDFLLAYRLAATHHQAEGVPFADAEWLAGWVALRFLNRPTEAARHFERLYEGVSTPISRARAAYWVGRAEAARRRSKSAATWYARAAAYPTTFYGQLASHELGRSLTYGLFQAPAPSEALRRAFAANDMVQVIERLCTAGVFHATGPLVRQLASEADGSGPGLGLVLGLAHRCGRPDLVVSLAKTAERSGAISGVASFPVPDVASLVKPAPGMPEPALLLAVARQESLFDPEAASAAGAQGIMQLMPSTARVAAGALGVQYDRSALTDPDYNARLGGWYLREQLDQFGGIAPLALAAYNAGPSRVTQWLQANGDPRRGSEYDMIDWIELIPFSETRNYVQRVMEAMQVYRALIETGKVRMTEIQRAGAGGSLAEAPAGKNPS